MEYPVWAQVKGTQGKSVRAKGFHSNHCLGEMLTGPRNKPESLFFKTLDRWDFFQTTRLKSIEQAIMSQLWDFSVASWPVETRLEWKN